MKAIYSVDGVFKTGILCGAPFLKLEGRVFEDLRKKLQLKYPDICIYEIECSKEDSEKWVKMTNYVIDPKRLAATVVFRRRHLLPAMLEEGDFEGYTGALTFDEFMNR